MAKFKIESQITLLTVVIAAAVIMSGYYVWQSLSSIVSSISQEARPDNKLFLLKDINNDLSAVESNIRLYVLTNSKNNLNQFDTLKRLITYNIQLLIETTPLEDEQRVLVDSFRTLSISKVQLWQGLLELHRETEGKESKFSEIYEQLEEQKFDTITETTVRRGFIRWLLGTKKVIIDTTISERNIEKDELKNQIENLQREIHETDKQVNLLESNLIAKNIEITNKIDRLISQAEQNEARSLIEKTYLADRMAAATYKRLAGFSVTAVLLLLLVLFLLYNYLKKMRIYERGLQNARQEAENLAIAKERFAANVSHEMRTPVNAIYGLAEQLRNRKDNKNLDEQISVLAQSATHLNNIINDTLDFSKIQAKKLKFNSEHFSPIKVFEEITALQKYGAAQKKLLLRSEFDKNLPKALIGDPLRLKQILINLIGNAIKFTERGEIVFKATADKKAKNTYDLKIDLSDTGIGITKKNLEIIFEEFVQAENQDGKKYHGTGLGLTIVKKLVELQGGKINIESEPEVGTTVNLSIPYAEGEPDKIIETRLEEVEIPDELRQINILIADDEEFNRYIFKTIFNKWGVKFSEVMNGKDAEEKAIQYDYDIILMDVRMPKKNGLEATQAILAEKPDAKIIAITASDDNVEKEKCKEAGMKGFLPKPFSELQLYRVISTTLNLKYETKSNRKQLNYISTLEKLANNDPIFLKDMISLFITSTQNSIEKIAEAIPTKDGNAISDLAHKIAPQCKQIGDKDLYQNIKELEKFASEQPFDEKKIKQLFKKIEGNIIEINQSLKDFLDS